MSVGFPVNKQVIDQRAGAVVEQLRRALDGVETVKAWLDARTDEEVAEFGYQPGEVALLKSAFTDLDKLRRIAVGEATQAEANDFWFWAGRLTGLG